jgi:3D (Asp-Asp-Asp) domain-containing protein
MKLQPVLRISGIAGILTLVFSLSAHASTVLGKFRDTYYEVALEEDYPAGPPYANILAADGTPLVRVSVPFKHSLDIEGSGRLNDGRVLNFVSRASDGPRYSFVKAEYGYGVGNCELTPFHTAAVDPKRIPLGALIYIDETDGMILPDGTHHDGYWKAEDIGIAIQKDRIDLFVGAGSKPGEILDKNGIHNLEPLTVRLIDLPAQDSCVYQTRN